MSADTTSSFADLLDPSFRDVMKSWDTSNPKYYDKYANVESISGRDWVKDSYVTGLPVMPTQTEGFAPTQYSLTQRLDKTYTVVDYGIMVQVSHRLQRHDISNTRIIKQIPSALSSSGRNTLEVGVANMLNRAGNGSYLGADGKTLLATDHPTAAAGSTSTFGNSAGSLALSMTTLQDAIITLESQKDEASLQANMRAKKLVVPRNLVWKAKELLGSDLTPESANNAVNTLKNGLELIVVPDITDTNCWFVIAESFGRQSPLNVFIDEELYLKSFMAVDGSQNAIFAAYQSFVTGWTNPMGIYGSMGTS